MTDRITRKRPSVAATHPCIMIVWVFLVFSTPLPAGDSLTVHFSYFPDAEARTSIVRAFLPGNFNGWGNNIGGRIPVDDPSQMTWIDSLSEFRYSKRLASGRTYQYKIHVQRSADGSNRQWFSDPLNPEKTGPDYNSVLEVGPLSIFQPVALPVNRETVIRYRAWILSADSLAELTAEIDGTVYDCRDSLDLSTGLFSFRPEGPLPAGTRVLLSATDPAGRTVTAQFGSVFADAPTGIKDGITYDSQDPSKATLVLRAPGKESVHLLLEENDWTAHPDFELKRDTTSEDGDRFWIVLEDLVPGSEVSFQYLVDRHIQIADPYAEKLLTPEDDEIEATTYPNLPPFPSERTPFTVSVLEPGKPAFSWSDTGYQRPLQDELIIYELLIRDFLAAHDFSTLVDTLDYLKDLGVNAVELMPVMEFERNSSWGYNPAFYFAPDKYYGPAEDLKRFVEACHENGIAVILDIVLNHSFGRSPLVRLYNSGDFGPPTSDNPWYNTEATHPFSVGYDFNHESSLTQRFIDRVISYWLKEYRVDGFRFDLSKGFTQKQSGGNVARWGAYDASRIALLQRLADRMWEVDSTAFVILEHFADPREERALASYGHNLGRPGMLLWHNMNRAYSQSAAGYLNESNWSSDLTDVYYKNRNFEMPSQVTYMESHDEQWLMYRNRAYGVRSGAYDIKRLPVALDRMKLVGAFFLTIPGPKMLWQFGELGYGYGPDGEECLRPFDGLGECPPTAPPKLDRKPIRWEYANDPLRIKLYRTWSELLRLRKNHSVFRSRDTEVEMNTGQGVAGRTIRLSHPQMNVVIAGNFGVESHNVAIDFQTAGWWYDFFERDSLDVSDPSTMVSMMPGEFHLYTSRRVEWPEPDLLTVAGEADGPVFNESGLSGGYPNPFETETTAVFTLQSPGHVRMDVFDILGRKVARLLDENADQGKHRVQWQAGSLPAGVYIIRLTAGKKVSTNKILKVR